MIAWMREACSSAVAFLIRMPLRAPMPVPTATAVGVASPSASGQAMTMAVTARVSAKSAVCVNHEEPDQERQQPRAHRRDHQPLRGAVRQSLGRRLRVLRDLDQLHDLRERCLAADFRGAEAQRAAAVHRPADDLIARRLSRRAGSRR